MPAGPAPEALSDADELAAFRSLELGDPDGRVSASCGNPGHPTWLRAEIDPRGCPWCEIDQAHQDVIGANLARHEEEQENARLRARIAELEARPLAWAERLDLKSLDNLLISLGQASEHEPMDEAIGQIHLILAGFREAALTLPVEEPADTLAAWLHWRFGKHGQRWDGLDGDDQSYWEHHAAAVRRAVKRGGFKAGGADVLLAGVAKDECPCPPADRPHQVGCPLAEVPAPLFPTVASLREPDGEHYPHVHHSYRVGHDLPETGGTQ